MISTHYIDVPMVSGLRPPSLFGLYLNAVLYSRLHMYFWSYKRDFTMLPASVVLEDVP